MIDVETGVRGYAITGEPAYLNPFMLAVEGLERQRKLVRRVELARGVIQILNVHGLDVARIKRQMDIGEETMDKVRALVQRMEAEQEALIKSRTTQSIAESETAQLIMMMGASLSITLLAMVMLLMLRENKLRRESE